MQNFDSDLEVDRMSDGAKSVLVGFSVLIYICFVVYSEYHFFNLISRFVPAGWQAVGYVAVAASALTAVVLPGALHVWFREGTQRLLGLIFYGIHFLIVCANLIVDGSLVTSGGASEFASGTYAVWVLPAYIAFYGLGWSILWMVDDGSKRLDKLRELKAVTTDSKVSRRVTVTKMQTAAVAKAFSSQGAQQAINLWAARNAPKMLAAELGMSVDELGANGDYRFWMPDEGEETAVGDDPPSFWSRLRGAKSGEETAAADAPPPVPADMPPGTMYTKARIRGVEQWVLVIPPLDGYEVEERQRERASNGAGPK